MVAMSWLPSAFVAGLCAASGAEALVVVAKSAQAEAACEKADLQNRVSFQNKLHGVCEEMCKEIKAGDACTCPGYVAPDATPGVMTWEELLEHMDNLVAWGHGELKQWNKQASALQILKDTQGAKSCTATDQAVRMQVQNKLAGKCEDMCKEVGAYPDCAQCPKFVQPDSTPGVMTWEELLEHMDNLVEWGQGEIKGWHKQASAIQMGKADQNEQACAAESLKHRAAFQNKLAGVCEEMCKEIKAGDACTCPGYVAPDATPGVMTWEELLEHMDNLVAWGHGELKQWNKQASALQILKDTQGAKSCTATDQAVRMQVQNKLAGKCEDMCKEVGAYPDCAQCPKFVQPDSTPGVMTWEELLEHMDNLVEWGQGEIKGWHKQASAIQTGKADQNEQACTTEDLQHRAALQNKLASVCEEMCREVGAYPKCPQCPKFVEPDSTPGVMTWEELLEHMDNLVEWGQGEIKGWHKQAS